MGLGAFSTAPLMPVPSLAAVPMADLSASHMMWAEAIAKGQGNSTPAMLARHLNVPQSMAQGLQNKLVENGVLGAPNTAGARVAMNPIDATGRKFGLRFSEVSDRISTLTKRLYPHENNDKRDDSIPTSHADPHEGPSDVVTTYDRRGEDLI